MTKDVPALPEFPQKDERNFGYRTARGAVGAFDAAITGGMLGATFGEVIDAAIGQPLEKRRAEWLKSLAEGFESMRQRVNGFDPAQLGDNEEFVSVVAEATQIALRSHKEEKRRALRNAVLNTAVGYKIDEVLRGAFMSYIDRFSGKHLRVLALLANPAEDPMFVEKAKTVYAGAQISVFKDVYPEFADGTGTLDRVLSDLNREGLADTSGMMAMASAGAQLTRRTSAYGDAFLRFIAEPE